MLRRFVVAAVAASAVVALSAVASPAFGAEISGAIFTTDVTGVPVNLNHYAAKEDVYLNGGPGINAPDSAAGLPAGAPPLPGAGPRGEKPPSPPPRPRPPGTPPQPGGPPRGRP